LTSVSPTELLTGKIIARGFTGLLQVIAWLAGGALLLKLGARTLPIPANASIPPSLFFWGIIYFLLGYAIYASLMAGLGAMVPNLREGSQTTIAVIFPLIVPMFFMNNLIVAPNSPISMFLGFFPLTAPVAMMTRIASGQTPLWQIVLSALIMAATAYLIVKAAAGLFRAQYLLSSGSFKPGKFYKALIGR
ncbi:MAG TPA: ABC transporter permease, partial [Bellilinea sp.]|nr:ABC transporter permease [Bellilinea sp.]